MSEIVERFQRIRRDWPRRHLIYLPARGTGLTADNLWAESLAHRSGLEALGLGPDHLVIGAVGNRPAALALWLACRSAGVALMPVDVGTTPAEIAALARRFGATVAIAADAFSGLVAMGAAKPFVDGLLAVRISGTAPAPQIYRGAAVLKVTSGSTGLPKAAFTTESQLVLDTEHICSAMDIRPLDVQIAAIPLSHAYGIGSLVIPLLLQGTAIVMREGFVPHQLPADAARTGARVFPGVPFMFDHFAATLSEGGWPRGLDLLISAGAKLDNATARAFQRSFGVAIHPFYGTSETGGISYDEQPDFSEDAAVGHALPGVTLSLVPEDGVPPDWGRVYVAGEAISSGYAGEEPGDGAFGAGGFLTGDLGRFDHRQRLVLTGRASSFINVAGRKVQPEEIELVLRTMPGIDDVRVVGASDALRGQQIVACVVSRGDGCSPFSIRQFCASRLAPYKIPRAIVRLERIPLTERGKLDRQRLDAIVAERLARVPKGGML